MITVDHKYIVPPAFSFGSYCSCKPFFPWTFWTDGLLCYWNNDPSFSLVWIVSLTMGAALFSVQCLRNMDKGGMSPNLEQNSLPCRYNVYQKTFQSVKLQLIHSLSFQCECDFLHKLSAVITVMQGLFITLDRMCQKMKCSVLRAIVHLCTFFPDSVSCLVSRAVLLMHFNLLI